MLFAYNGTVHSSTNFTPFLLHMGRQPKTPFDTLAETLIDTKKKSAQEYLSEMQKKMSQMYKLAQGNISSSMEKRKAYRDKNAHYTTYQRGDLVLLRQFTCKPGLKPKLLRERWTGPWTIDKMRGPVNYRITRKFQGKKQRVLVHHDRLKPFQERPSHLREGEENVNLEPPETIEHHEPQNDSNKPPETMVEKNLNDEDSDSDEEQEAPDYESAEEDQEED